MTDNSLTDLSYFDTITLMAALGRQLKACDRAIAHNDKKGWSPEPGKIDINRLRRGAATRLLNQLRATPHGQALAANTKKRQEEAGEE